MKPLLAIDPGASGGLAWCDRDGIVYCEPMPEGMTAQVDMLRTLAASLTGIEATVERVGTYMPGNSGPAAATFARHCGTLETALYCLGVPTVQVTPKRWQKYFGALPKDKMERKRAVKELMSRKHPALSVTLKTADALAILDYACGNGHGS